MPIPAHRKVIAFVAAAAIAITGLGASQARANDYATERTIAALLGLAVIGAIAADRGKAKQTPPPVVYQAPRHAPNVHKPKHHARFSPLPRHCLIRVETHRGPLNMFKAPCMRRSYPAYHSLPERCIRRVETARGYRPAYAAPCLRKAGFQMARY